jgi:hypothetical protein
VKGEVRTLRRLIALCSGAVAVGAAGYALAATQTVALTSTGPQPPTQTIPWGGTLEVRNADTVAHSLTSAHAELRAAPIQPGGTFTTTFTSGVRSYNYRQTGTKGFAGKVVVDFGGHVSLQPSTAGVTFGHAVALKGVASIANTPVAIEIKPAGEKHWQQFRTVTSGAAGGYSTTTFLQRGARFRSTIAVGRIKSASKAVNVKPRLSIRRKGKTVRTAIAPAHAASLVTLECLLKSRHWKRLSSRRPNAAGKVVFRPRRGSRGIVRVVALPKNLGDGYVGVRSRPVLFNAAC